MQLALTYGFNVRGNGGRTKAICLVLMFFLYDDMLHMKIGCPRQEPTRIFCSKKTKRRCLKSCVSAFLRLEGFGHDAGHVERLHERLKTAAENIPTPARYGTSIA